MSGCEPYTAFAGHDKQRRRARAPVMSFPGSGPAWMPLFFLVACSTALASFVACIPFFYWDYFLTGRFWRSRSSNRSLDENGGSRTAIKVLQVRSETAYIGFGPDILAPLFAKQVALSGSTSTVQVFLTRFHSFLSRMLFRITGFFMTDALLQMFSNPFPLRDMSFIHSRTCFFDDVVNTFVSRLGNADMGNIVIVGAGYDSRCYRLHPSNKNLRRVEIDAKGTQYEKQRVLEGANVHTDGVLFLPCDFATENWREVLVKGGVDLSLPTCYLWEGVTYYLPPEAMKANLAHFATAMAESPGSCVAFDYFSDWASKTKRGRGLQTLLRWIGEPWLCVYQDDDDLRTQVEASGLHVLELAKSEHCKERYLRMKNGCLLGELGDFGGFCVCEARAAASSS